MTATAIAVSGLVKTFGPTRALDGLDLTVNTGEVHGFLGPNGAGKTTTLRILLGLLRADAGTVRLLGGDPWKDAVALHRRLRGGLDPHRRAELLDRFQLDPRKKGRAYSKGNRQKVALVAALASDVELLVLDEPTSGLDPLMETVFQDCMEEERNAGRTVLLSSHILAEAEKLCDRLSIIREGRVVETGTLADMRHLTRTLVHADLERPVAGLDKLPGVHDLQVNGTDGTRVSCQVDTAELGGFLRHLSDYGVRDLVSQPPTLEELFLRHYEAATPAGDGQATREGARRWRASPAPGSSSGSRCAATG